MDIADAGQDGVILRIEREGLLQLPDTLPCLPGLGVVDGGDLHLQMRCRSPVGSQCPGLPDGALRRRYVMAAEGVDAGQVVIVGVLGIVLQEVVNVTSGLIELTDLQAVDGGDMAIRRLPGI